MNTKQLEYALVLEMEASFSRAAEKLNITQPSLSQYIKKLEGEVGAELFVRLGQRVVPTKAGEAFLRAAKQMMAIERGLSLEISDILKDNRGVINIGVSPSRSVGALSGVITEFCKKYPEIQVNLYEKTVSELQNELSEQKYDICILPSPPNNSRFEVMDLYLEKTVIAVPLHIAKKLNLQVPKEGKTGSLDFSLLKGQPFITLFEGQPMRELLRELCEMSGVEVDIRAKCVNIETSYALAAEGLGIALIPHSMLDIRKHTLRLYYPKGFENGRQVCAVLPSNSYHSRPVMELLEMIKR